MNMVEIFLKSPNVLIDLERDRDTSYPSISHKTSLSCPVIFVNAYIMTILPNVWMFQIQNLPKFLHYRRLKDPKIENQRQKKFQRQPKNSRGFGFILNMGLLIT